MWRSFFFFSSTNVELCASTDNELLFGLMAKFEFKASFYQLGFTNLTEAASLWH